MGSMARYEPPSVPDTDKAILPSTRAPLRTRLRRVPELWNGEFTADPDEVGPPTWESLPAEVRWKLTGQDQIPGAAIASFVVAPVVRRRGSSYQQETSGWLLHEKGLFTTAAIRPLKPATRKQYRPAGEWTVEHRCVRGSGFRLKRATLPPPSDSSQADDDRNVPPQLVDLWRSIPDRPRALLAQANDDHSVDDGCWWVISDGPQVRMWMCYQRRSSTELRAVWQTRAAQLPPGAEGAATARMLAEAAWDVCVFSASLTPSTAEELGRAQARAPLPGTS